MKKILITLAVLVVTVIIGLVISNRIIENDTQAFNSSDINAITPKKIGLLLGTTKNLDNGQKNLYFYYRIDAAEALYKAGKIKYIIASGDHSKSYYNEPEDMKEELISRGIPAEHIFLDYAGFRTLDSVIRANAIFGQKDFIVISQKFHNERAVYLAQKNGLTAFGFNAKDVNKQAGLKTNIRECFARIKVFLDLILNVEPKFYGEKINIE